MRDGFESTDLWEQQLRNAVGFLLDGVLPPDDVQTVALWQACDRANHRLPKLASLLRDERVAVRVSRCDRIHRVLRELTCTVLLNDSDQCPDDVSILFLPCAGRHPAGSEQQIEAVLASGGVVVSSDRSIELEPLRSILPGDGRGGPQRTRASLPGWDSDAYLPALELAAGHARLCPSIEHRDGVRVLLRSVHSHEAIVVLVPAGQGHVLHAVPHWFQQGQAQFTAIERRRVRDVDWLPAFQHAADDAQIGDVLATLAMSTCLRLGLVLAGVGRQWSGEHVSDMEEVSLRA